MHSPMVFINFAIKRGNIDRLADQPFLRGKKSISDYLEFLGQVLLHVVDQILDHEIVVEPPGLKEGGEAPPEIVCN